MSETTPVARTSMYVMFSDDGQHIRKWSFTPFEGGTLFAAAPVSDVSEATPKLRHAAQAMVDFVGQKDIRVYATDPVVRDLRAALTAAGGVANHTQISDLIAGMIRSFNPKPSGEEWPRNAARAVADALPLAPNAVPFIATQTLMDAADYLVGHYKNLWLNKDAVVRDLAEAEGSYEAAKNAVRPKA